MIRKGTPENAEIAEEFRSYEIYKSILEKRIRVIIDEPQLTNKVHRFREKHRVQDYILHSINWLKRIYCHFIDLRKAFDKIKRKEIWISLAKLYMYIFADNPVLIAENGNYLEKKDFKIWIEEALKYDLELNTGRTKTMIIASNKKTRKIK